MHMIAICKHVCITILHLGFYITSLKETGYALIKKKCNGNIVLSLVEWLVYINMYSNTACHTTKVLTGNCSYICNV